MKKKSNQERQVHMGKQSTTWAAVLSTPGIAPSETELTPDKAERHVGFETLETFAQIMTPKRLALLRHVHRHPAPSIRALAAALGRNYRRVHADVEALAGVGLLDRNEQGLHADYRTVKMEMTIAL
jgi:predicted transcriptional regulator